jgi:undecaprenyl diphosphate synthase
MQHIGYIMDGNRTWAAEKGLPSLEGHRQGYENAKSIIKETKNLGIPYASFWALSDDNIRKRAPEEVGYLFQLLERWILDLAQEAHTQNIRIMCVGDRTLLPEKCVKNIRKAEKITEKNTEMTVIIAVGYGWQEEIMRAVHSLAHTGKDMTQVTLLDMLAHIETSAFPPPDIIVRTGWHVRHSGFFLFHSPYAEYYFSEKNWPEFSRDDIISCIETYNDRTRKYGQ